MGNKKKKWVTKIFKDNYTITVIMLDLLFSKDNITFQIIYKIFQRLRLAACFLKWLHMLAIQCRFIWTTSLMSLILKERSKQKIYKDILQLPELRLADLRRQVCKQIFSLKCLQNLYMDDIIHY